MNLFIGVEFPGNLNPDPSAVTVGSVMISLPLRGQDTSYIERDGEIVQYLIPILFSFECFHDDTMLPILRPLTSW